MHRPIADFSFEVTAMTNDDEVFKLKVDFGRFSLELLLINVFSNCDIEFAKAIG